MKKIGKERFKLDIETFVAKSVRPIKNNFQDFNVGKYIRLIDKCVKYSKYRYIKETWSEKFPQVTHHEICNILFLNAFMGRYKMYIQIPKVRKNKVHTQDLRTEVIEEKEKIILQCSLLTSQMLDYDSMMFDAMRDNEDIEYRNAAREYYRPYFFSYIMEVDEKVYEELMKLQTKPYDSESSKYLWLPCTFVSDKEVSYTKLTGYVVQSASPITKIMADLNIIENEGTQVSVVKNILSKYTLDYNGCLKDDTAFIQMLKGKLGTKGLASIDVYKIGNGNCVFAQGLDTGMSFFYDIGFNYRHRPQKISSKKTYQYSGTMQDIAKKNPSFFILSHWDMDHIAGITSMKKDAYEKDWFAPDCYDACLDAKRLAVHINLRNHLFLVKRSSKTEEDYNGRLIGSPIDIKSTMSEATAMYRLYMGEKDVCDSSISNCEGIVLEYTDLKKKKKVLMMGDVNYTSFNKAQPSVDTSFANRQIDYLIVPHHGSEHTGYEQITENGKLKKRGTMAIICCTDETKINRPNNTHRKELMKRFDYVRTTERSKLSSISICLE